LNGDFTLNSVLPGMFEALKTGFVVNFGKLEAGKNSCGIARFPCDSTAFSLTLLGALRSAKNI